MPTDIQRNETTETEYSLVSDSHMNIYSCSITAVSLS